MKAPALALSLLAVSASPAWAQDLDGDGAADVVDGAPCDGAVAGWAFAPAEGLTGTLLFEDEWPDIGDGDFNDLVLAYNYEVALDAQGRAVRVVARFEALAVGGDFDNGLALHLPIPKGAATGISVQVGGGSWAPAMASAQDAELAVVLSSDLRSLFGGQPGPINVFGAAQRGLPIVVQVDLVPVALDMGAAPFDVFLFRRADPAHEVHRTGYPGTAAMNTALFGTGSDASDVGRSFVDGRNLPFVLHLPDAVVYPAEGLPVETVFPRIVNFAASSGAQDADFYVGDVVAANAYAGTLAPAAVPAASVDTSCIPQSCLAAKNGGATSDGAYLIAPGAQAPFEVYCDMTSQGGGWTLFTSVMASGPASTAGTVAAGSRQYMPSARIQALANLSTQAYLRTIGDHGRYIISTANTTPIFQLRNLQSLSANPGGYNAAHWSGSMTNQMWYDCGGPQAYPTIYWACNNTSGLHMSTSAPRWVYSAAPENIEGLVR